MKELRDVTPTDGSVSDSHSTKLMCVCTSCKLFFPRSSLLPAVLLTMCLAGCPTPPRAPAPPAGQSAPLPPPLPAREGRPYDIASSDSLLTIQAFRGGALAKAG